MPTLYPAAKDDNSTLPTKASTDLPTDHAQIHTNAHDSIKAIETKVGIGSSTPTAGKLLTGNGTGSSSWQDPTATTWGTITGTLSSQTDLNTALTGKLALAGGTLTGPLVLAADPAAALGAATKQYVDTADSATSVLGYAQIVSSASNGSATPTLATGLTISVTIPALNGRRVEITAFTIALTNSNAGQQAVMTIWDGPVNTGTQLSAASTYAPVNNTGSPAIVSAVPQPSAGPKTYNIGIASPFGGGSATINCSTTAPAYILAKII